MLRRVVRVSPSLSSIAVIRAKSNTTMNKYGSIRSHWRHSALILNDVVSPELVRLHMCLHSFLYDFADILWDAIRMKNPENYVS